MDFLWINELLTCQSPSKVTSLVYHILCNKGVCYLYPFVCGAFFWVNTDIAFGEVNGCRD